jgi:hypothetical protein
MMSHTLDIRQAERKIFTNTFQDGLLDILISAFLLMFAIAPILSTFLGDFWSSAVFLPFWGLVYLGVYLLKVNVTQPRLGQARLGAARRRRLTVFSIIMCLINGAFLVGGLFVSIQVISTDPNYSGASINLGFGSVMLLFGTLAGIFLDLPRLIAYGLLAGLAPVIGQYLYIRYGIAHHGYPLTFGILTGIIFLVGATLFVRLLQRNPLPGKDVLESQE